MFLKCVYTAVQVLDVIFFQHEKCHNFLQLWNKGWFMFLSVKQGTCGLKYMMFFIWYINISNLVANSIVDAILTNSQETFSWFSALDEIKVFFALNQPWYVLECSSTLAWAVIGFIARTMFVYNNICCAISINSIPENVFRPLVSKASGCSVLYGNLFFHKKTGFELEFSLVGLLSGWEENTKVDLNMIMQIQLKELTNYKLVTDYL